MNTASLFELLKLIATGLALLSDTSKVKRTFKTVLSEWSGGTRDWRRAVVDIVIILISMGGPLHYGFQIAHEIAVWS